LSEGINPRPTTNKMKIQSKTQASGIQFFYVETPNDGFMCSFLKTFEDVWFISDLESDEPEEAPENVEALISDISE
jgi:hypothetical protein